MRPSHVPRFGGLGRARRPAEYTDQAFVSTGDFERVFEVLRTWFLLVIPDDIGISQNRLHDAEYKEGGEDCKLCAS